METDYWNSFDKKEYSVDPSRLGISTAIPKKALDQLKPRISEGATHVELGFMGKGKGSLSQGGTTPEMHGKTEREEVRELAKINEIGLTTHSSIALGNLAGLTDQGFNDQERANTISEINRTTDFAAEVAEGGPVVIHTGEFSRPIIEAERGFKGYGTEEKKAPVLLADEKTGKIVNLPRDIEIQVPIVDKEGERIFDEKTGTYEFEKRTYADYEEETKKGETHQQAQERINKLKEKLKTYIEKDKEPTTGHLFFLDYKKRELDQHSWEERRWAAHAEETEKERKKLDGKIESLRKHEKKDKDGAKYWAIKFAEEKGIAPNFKDPSYDEFNENPIKFIEQRRERIKREEKYYEDASVSYGERARYAAEEMRNIKPVEDVAIKKTSDTISDAAMHAFNVEKHKKLKKDLYISPENIFPEQYGSHPDELKKIVIESRKAMVEKLKGAGHHATEAKEIAENHIKATFDIGHAYTWKKYFEAKKDETPEQAEKRFNKWVIDKAKEMQKEGILGHVHVSDNFGYQDEHLAPGEGSVPIKEFMKEIEKEGYKGKTIVEWGAQTPEQSHKVLTGAWKTLNSPVYKIDGYQQSWTDMEGSYFGKTKSPTYTVGDYAPSKDWTLWSETPLE